MGSSSHICAGTALLAWLPGECEVGCGGPSAGLILPHLLLPSGVEDKEAWHGKPLPKNMADQTIQEIYSLIQSKKKILATPPQEDAPSVDIANIRMPTPPSYKPGDKVHTHSGVLLLWTDWDGC